MMGKYPGAVVGMKKIFAAQIVSVISILFVFLPFEQIVIVIVGLVLAMLGLMQAEEDHQDYRKAWKLVLINIVLSMIKINVSMVPAIGDILATLTGLASTVVELQTVNYVMKATGQLLDHADSGNIFKTGKIVWSIYQIFIIVGIICTVVNMIPLISMSPFSSVIRILVGLFFFVAGIAYLIYLGRAQKCLKACKTDNAPVEGNKKITKKHLLLRVLLLLGIFLLLQETGVINKHVYRKIENMGERNGVCFDNLIFSYTIGLKNISNREMEYKYLCIFNTGDIYCFEWPETELTPWSWYYYKDEGFGKGYNDASWNKTANAVYLGRLSFWQTGLLNRYVKNYDTEGEYFVNWKLSVEVPNSGEQNWWVEGTDGNGLDWQNRQIVGTMGEPISEWRWSCYSAWIYWHEQPEKDLRMDDLIESCDINYLSGNLYEKGEIWYKSYDENAIAAIDLFELSSFYHRWVYMCLNNE